MGQGEMRWNGMGQERIDGVGRPELSVRGLCVYIRSVGMHISLPASL